MKNAPLQIIFFFTALVLSAFSYAPATLSADEIRADEVKITTPEYKPAFGEFQLPLGEYVYEVSWEGIPAAKATVTVDEDGVQYKLGASARTYSAIDLFYKLRYEAHGIINSADLKPVSTIISHKENSREKETKISFDENGEIHAFRSQKGKTTEEIRFNPKNFTLDPFSAAFLARSLDWKKGDSKQFDTFNGKTRYLLTLNCDDMVTMKVNGEERNVWVIVPKVEKLTDPNSSKKLRSAKIYVTADKSRDVLQIVSSVFIGSVKTRLTSFTPYERGLGPAHQVAQALEPVRIFFK